MLEDLGVVYATPWVQELLEPKKATYPLISESGADYSWDESSDDLKEAFIGFIAVNDLAESSSTSVISQLQVFGRTKMASAAAIIVMARNGFLDRLTTNKEMSDKKISMFHDFLQELQTIAIICAVQEDPATRKVNTNAMYRHRDTKQEMDNMVKQEVLENAIYEFIQCLIYVQMWDSDRL